MSHTPSNGQGITRKAFLTGAAAGAAAFTLRSPLLWGKDTPIKIGGHFSLTGGLGYNGIWLDRAAAAAVRKINQEGGIKGRKLTYVVEDTETNVQTGIRKMRKLIERDEVDFVVSDAHSGVNIASAPIAEEENTVYFASGAAVATTQEKGNRYIFRGITNLRIHMKSLVVGRWQQWGKRWYTLAADYAWGHSVAAETARFVQQEGGTVVGQKFAPLGTPDFIPYLSGLDPDAIDVIVIGFFGRDARAIITQINQLFGRKVEVTGNVGVIEGFTPKDIGPGGQGVWYTTQYPRFAKYVRDELKPFDKAFRQHLGIDDNGFGKDGSVSTIDWCYSSWEHVHYIKHAIEQSGWKSRQDNPKFIRALEGMKVQASLDFPQGDKVIRAQDHQVFHDQYLSRIEGEKLVVKEYVPKEKLLYASAVDYTKRPF